MQKETAAETQKTRQDRQVGPKRTKSTGERKWLCTRE